MALKLNKYEPGLNPDRKMRQMRQKRDDVDGDADALGPAVFGVGLGAANALQRKFGNECSLKN